MSYSDRYLRQVALSALFNTATSVIATALLLPLVIRRVGMEVYGCWALLSLFIGAASIIDFGIWKAVVYVSAGSRWPARRVLWTAASLCLGAWLAMVLLLCLLLALHVPVFGVIQTRAPQLAWWLAGCGSVATLASLLTNLLRALLEYRQRVHLVNVGYGLLTLLLYLTAALFGGIAADARLLLASSAAVYVAIFVGHTWLVSRDDLRPERPRAAIARKLLQFGSGSFAADLPLNLLGPAVALALVQFAAGAADYGTFDIALRIATLAATALGMLATPVFALVAGSRAPDALAAARVRIRLLLHLMLGCGLAGWLLFLSVGLPLLRWVFPVRPEDIHRAALLLMAGTVSLACVEPLVRLLMGLGRLRALAVARAALLPTAAVSLWLLMPLTLLMRFAIALAAGHAAAALCVIWLARRAWISQRRQPDVASQAAGS